MSVRAGRRLAKSWNSSRRRTLEERKPPPTGVASGPFKASRVLRMLSSVALGSGSPSFLRPATPAVCHSNSKGAPTASSTRRVASATSGPMPSPGIKVTGIFLSPLAAAARRVFAAMICPLEREWDYTARSSTADTAGTGLAAVLLVSFDSCHATPRARQSQQALRDGPFRRRHRAIGGERRVHLPPRAVGLRQDDDASDDRGLHRARCGRDPRRRQGDLLL